MRSFDGGVMMTNKSYLRVHNSQMAKINELDNLTNMRTCFSYVKQNSATYVTVSQKCSKN